MLIIDAHLDLSMNALEWNRNLRLPLSEIREQETGMTDKLDRAKGVVSLPELRRGKIGLVVATQIARCTHNDSNLPGWHSPEQAWAQTQGQLAWYKAMEDAGEMVQITNLSSLQNHIALWENEEINTDHKPIGFILSLEGTDSLIDLSYLEKAHQMGLRAVGPAHYGPGRYAPGTGLDGPFSKIGLALLKEMGRLNMILDVTHLTDHSFEQAMELYQGPVWASHHNCRALVNHQRQLTDHQIKELINRGSVIGGVLDAWMLTPNWVRGTSDSLSAKVNLEKLIDHYDHICQLAGNSNHIAIGSDLDGMFGKEQCPYDLDSIADLQNYQTLLAQRGYVAQDIKNIFHGNWIRFLTKAWT